MTVAVWPTERLKHVAEMAFSSVDKKSLDGEVPVKLCNYTDVYYNDEIKADIPLMEATASLDQVQRFGLRAGDVVITKDSETADDIGVGAFVPETPDRVVCGYHLAVLRPKPERIDPKYLFWSVCSGHMRQQMTLFASGVTRFGLRFGDVGNLRLFVPNLATQRAAARFLDRETARIDAILTAKLHLVELVRGRWAALIARMTDNSSWPQMRLKRLLSRRLEYGIGEPAEYDDQAWPRYIRTTDLSADGDLREDTFKSLPPEIAAPYLLSDGDLLFTRSGATVGKSFLYREEWGPACFAGYLIRATADRAKALPQFLSYFARSEAYWSQIKLLTLQATIQNVSAERYDDVVVRVPPLAEQQRVIAVLQEAEGRLSNLRILLMKQVAFLREHRQALITAVVTGQVDSSGEAA